MVDAAATRLAGSPDAAELLVVGPSIGTSAEALWGRCAQLLAPRFEVVGWDIPGHGHSRPTGEAFSLADLAAAVRDVALQVAGGREAHYAGVSLGGAVGFELALEPGPFAAVAAIAAAPKIGEPAGWYERAELVRRAGMPVLVAGAAERWFAPGFVDRQPEVAAALFDALSDSDRFCYALACEALAGYDVRARLGEMRVPFLLAAGEHDPVVTPAAARAAVPDAAFEVIAGCGHLPPAEDPTAVAALLDAFFSAGGLR